MKYSFLKNIAILSVCVVAIFGCAAWYSTVSTKSAEVADLQNKIDAKKETMARVAGTRATLSGIKDDEAVVFGYFVPETGVVPFIDAIEAQGETLGTVVRVLSVSASGTKTNQVPALLMSLSVKGEFDSVLRTVGSIEYAPYAISISNLSMTKDTVAGWQADIKLIVGSVSATRSDTVPQTASSTAPVRVSFI